MGEIIKLYLNNEEIIYSGNVNATLLEFLRQQKLIMSVKNGCSGSGDCRGCGACGACLVEVNGKPMKSCLVKMSKLNNVKVLTLEGLPRHIREILANAFVSSAAVQCGFCSPGMLMKAYHLIMNNETLTRDMVYKGLKDNLCRCTGYKNIVDAILLAKDVLKSGEKYIHFDSFNIGKSPPKVKAFEKAIGSDPFIDDMKFEGMLFGALKFTDYPKAKILKIDLLDALKSAGVLKVLTAKDIPGSKYVGMIKKDWPVYIDVGEDTNFIGDVLACVIAESEEAARSAASKIKVEYEVLKPVTDVLKAYSGEEIVYKSGNILKETVIKYGQDVQEVFKNSEYVAKRVLKTQLIEHAYLEVEASIAIIDGDKLTVYSQGQGIFEDRKQLASLLNISENNIIVKLVAAGGAFGGKEDLTVQTHAALAAFLLKRPVKVKLNREESIKMSVKRHPTILDYQLSCDKNGKFTGFYARIIGDTGAYSSVGAPVMDRAATHAGGAYFIPNIDVKSSAVFTNNIPAGAMRGFGVNQVTFAIETLIDDLCEMGSFDRWQIRYDNALDVGLTTTSGHLLRKEVGLKKTLNAIKEKYYGSKNVVGIACAIKNSGIGNGLLEESKVLIHIFGVKHIMIYHGWSEMGQGIDTVAVQFLSEELNLDNSYKFEVYSSTEFETLGGSTTASRGTYLIGKAIIDAATKIKEDLKNSSLAELVGNKYYGYYVCDWTTPPDFKGEMISHFAYSFATHLVLLDNNGKIEKVIAAHDSGHIVNKKLFEGQIHGGVVMGMGYALRENLKLVDGMPQAKSLGQLGLLKSHEVPQDIEVITVETDDVDAPYGAKGIGEISSIPISAAIANAYRIYDKHIYEELPLKRK